MHKTRNSILFLLPFISYVTCSHSAVEGLRGQIFPVPGISKDSTSAGYSQRVELLDKVNGVLEALLYSKEGKEKALEDGRRILKDYQHGSITIIDTKENQQKVQDYLDQLGQAAAAAVVKPQSKLIRIKHADPNNIRNLVNQIIQESRRVPSRGNSVKGNVGDFITGVISPGAGNGLTFNNDVTVELIDFPSQDTTNPSARLYIYTLTRDREITLSKGNSELVDAYRIRLVTANPIKQDAEIEIRLATKTNPLR